MKSKFALTLASLIMSQSAFAIYDLTTFPKPKEEIAYTAQILAKLAKASKDDRLGTVEIPTSHLFESIEKDPAANSEFLVRFKSRFEGQNDLCVAVTHIFVTKKVETLAVPCP